MHEHCFFFLAGDLCRRRLEFSCRSGTASPHHFLGDLNLLTMGACSEFYCTRTNIHCCLNKFCIMLHIIRLCLSCNDPQSTYTNRKNEYEVCLHNEATGRVHMRTHGAKPQTLTTQRKASPEQQGNKAHTLRNTTRVLPLHEPQQCLPLPQ